MADSFTTRLRLSQQTDQGNVNIWGKNFNEGVIDAAEAAICGYVNISLTLGNVTLTMSNGAEDTSRPMFLRAIGTTGSSRTITVPSLQKMYVVSNLTANDVEVRTTANAGVTVSAGQSMLMYVDENADTVKAIVDSTTVAHAGAAANVATQVFNFQTVSAGDSSATLQYFTQGNMIFCRLLGFSYTGPLNDSVITMLPVGTIPDALLPTGPLANEFPLLMEESGTPTGAWISIPNTSSNWTIKRVDAASWGSGNVRALPSDAYFVMHQVG